MERNAIPVQYGQLTQNIIDRRGEDICPMERAVLQTQDAEEGYRLLLQKMQTLAAEAARRHI